MTSINAIRFNRKQGACLCDESISSTDDMRLDVSDKFEPCIPTAIVSRYGVVAAIASTGSCSVGGEIKHLLVERITRHYEQEIEKNGRPPEKFLPLSRMAAMVFDIIVDLKYRGVSNKFVGDYGFSIAEFLAGSYERDGKTYEIKDKDTIRDLTALLSWKYNQEEVAFIFNNALLFAGYDDEEGFCIFHYDLRSAHWHRVQNCYMAEGSGRHSMDPAMYGFAENLLLENRRGDVDRTAGLMAMIYGLSSAVDHEIGVNGYPNFILIDGGQEDYAKRLREIGDRRSFLALQILRALGKNFIDYQSAYLLIDELVFEMRPFEEMYDKFFSQTTKREAMARMLRGYKTMPWHQELEDTRRRCGNWES